MQDYFFDEVFVRDAGAAEGILESFHQTWKQPLTEEEIQEIIARQKNPFPKNSPYYNQYIPIDPTRWRMPQGELPGAYAEFLRYSDGGEFRTGERYFQFFSTSDLREMNLAYELPEYMPLSVSFAMDGCGNHYLFDMRKAPVEGEYPILAAHSGNLGYDECVRVADSFEALCRGKRSLDEELDSRYT
ncbi:SMI1/KNR4 family protein [Paenibacillus chitinolyticus]|uniref:SMI1/KNR4 family protein n=1 Tax=Paenibacillus chitinolyticus TaxID=79263 RepID=UPI00366D4143